MTNENLRMQMLSGIITEGEYKAKLEEKASLNESMIGGIVGVGAINQIPSRAKADYEMAFEHFLGERYTTNFENREQDPYTMKEDDSSNDMDQQIANLDEGGEEIRLSNEILDFLEERGMIDPSDAQKVHKDLTAFLKDKVKSENLEEIALEKTPLDENIVGDIVDKILRTFEFSQKGNDEMIEFGEYLLSPEGPKNIAMTIKSRLKGEGGEKYFTSDPEKLQAFLSKLR